MDKREPRSGYVAVTVELPRDVADMLAGHQRDLVSIIEALGHQCRCLPPTDEVRAESDRLLELKKIEWQNKFRKLGRAGYRLYRQRIKTNGYDAIHGEYRDRPAKLSKAQWHRVVMTDIAKELGVSREYIELAIPRFRKELNDKIKPRRDQAIIRHYLEGASNAEIADRVSVSVTHVINFIKLNRDHLRILFRELPESNKPLETKKRRKILGKSRGQGRKAPWNLPSMHTGGSN